MNTATPLAGALALALLLDPATLRAQSVTADGILEDDTTIFEEQPNDNAGNNIDFCVGNLQMASMTRRGLIRYSLPAIPAGATVERVTLDLRQDRVRGQGAGPLGATVQVYRLTEDWQEGSGAGGGGPGPCEGGSGVAGVNWFNQPAFASPPSAEAAFNTGRNVTQTLDSDVAGNGGLVDDVQSWVDSGENFGWLVAVAEESQADNARWMEAGTLSVTWTESDDPPFVLNQGLNDAWFEPATSGQGVLFNVFPERGLVFLAWFTYDTERPPADVTAVFGEPGHRWVTAIGPFVGDTAMLDVTLTSGGLFDQPRPDDAPPADPAYGTITVVFNDCNSADFSYSFPDLGLADTIPLQRVIPDNVAFCESLQAAAPAR